MPTIVSLTAKDLSANFSALMARDNLGPLRLAVMSTLNSPANYMEVANVMANIVGDGKGVKFTINPDGLDPIERKAPLR